MKVSALTILITSVLSTTVLADTADQAQSRMYGQAAPFELDNLPQSKLRSKLETLPAPARERALRWLNRFSFHSNDIANINVDQHGAVFYSDTELPQPVTQAELEANPTDAGIDPTDAFKLHSKPSAANVVYVNFIGFDFSGTAWNSYTGIDNYQAMPYDTDGVSSSFSISELKAIAEIWHRISEDYAAFDIDVTTEPPAVFGPNVGHILITRSTDAKGDLLPHGDSAGGIAFVDVWGYSNYPSYQPALVYYDNLGSGYAPYVSEAASHELGHNLSLSHDGTSTLGYYTGLGSGASSWAPIMGVGYYTNVTQWSKGEYPDANNQQNDIAIIQSKLSQRSDEHADDSSSAIPLLVDVTGNIASSNPEFDPLNVRTDNKGVIETANDIDVFYFDTASGDINLIINPAWDAYTRTNLRGANLDLKATLTDDYGTVIVDDVLNETNAVISENVTAGRYYLAIAGVGNTATPYSDYGSQGQYYISGSIVPASVDITPPNPTPTLYLTETTRTTIDMSSSQSVDESGVVDYQFICSDGGLGCVASDWQTGLDYNAKNLASNTQYRYQVKARDASGNETVLSNEIVVSTDVNNDPITLNDNQISVTENTATTIDVLANDMDPDGDTLIIDSVSVPENGEVSILGSNLVYTPDSNYLGGDSFTYTILDGFGGNSTSTVNLTVIADVNLAPTAVISVSSTSGQAPHVITFDGRSSSDSDGSVVSYSWVFGDGTTGAESVMEHSYNVAGSFTVTLTVTDDKGKTSSVDVVVSVTEPAAKPLAPSNLAVTVVEAGKGKNKVVTAAELNWTDNSNNETNFVIERCQQQTTGKGRSRDTVCSYVEYATVGIDKANLVIPTDSGYQYRVKAINEIGASSYSNEVSI